MPVGETGPESQDLWRLTTGLTREESHWGTEGREFKSPLRHLRNPSVPVLETVARIYTEGVRDTPLRGGPGWSSP